ncbi:Trypanosome variant surface glycoprotein (A-type) [Trypanosoma brucei equiperdum]|uniref:Trypanosome variant surface glycoprotein (A-type) n=1 Tax=Trypanosoma brucei equiperdum TaxID=630700 RepID=A0A3L6LB42_9TRYP|nr:Trypanosome variant surface glycoprotein (A-type) [Trypanosoma brucei equiperdum]
MESMQTDNSRSALFKIALTPIIVTLYATSTCEATVGGGLKKSYWAEVCDLAKDSEKIPKLALHNLQATAQNAQTALTRLLRLMAYNEIKTRNTVDNKTAALWQYLAKKTSTELQDLVGNGMATAITATRNAARFQGAVMDFMQLLASTGTAGNKGCLNRGESNAETVQGQTKLATEYNNCGIDFSDVTPGTEAAKLMGPTGAEIQNKAGGTAQTIATGATTCNINSVKSTWKMVDDATGGNPTVQPSMGGNIFTVDSTGLKMDALADVTNKAQSHPFIHAHHKATLQLNTPKTQFPGIKVETLGQDPDFQAAARYYLLGKNPTDSSGDANLQSKINAHYTNSVALNSIVETAVDSETIPKELTDNGTQQNLGSITDAGQLLKIYLHYHNVNIAALNNRIEKLQEEATKIQTPKTAEDKQKLCDKHHDSKTDCDTKDFCTYDKTESTDKKCKYNATKATANGVPVTQAQTGEINSALDR